MLFLLRPIVSDEALSDGEKDDAESNPQYSRAYKRSCRR